MRQHAEIRNVASGDTKVTLNFL